MTTNSVKELAAHVIREEFCAVGLIVKKIILFGSRARGNETSNSDWDFLVSINTEIPFHEKALLCAKIQTRLAEKLISADIIVKSENSLIKDSRNPGVVSYYALKDGILL